APVAVGRHPHLAHRVVLNALVHGYSSFQKGNMDLLHIIISPIHTFCKAIPVFVQNFLLKKADKKAGNVGSFCAKRLAIKRKL
ncbi:MAG: hypothetical protein IIX86_05470, partial [Clostridia bacterium]|nr:hypothetical protein [Clostridia bacterium]